MRRTALALAGEVTLALLLVVRHRAVRLTAVLAFALAALTYAAGDDASTNARRQTVLVVAGSLAAVGASRLFAPGAPLAAARWAAGPWWRAPAGRLLGAWLVAAPAAATAALVLVAPADGSPVALRVTAAAGGQAAALGSLVAALSPIAGASAAATLGLLAAWLGGIPPSAMAAVLDGVPYLQRPVVGLWNLLPLDWRAARWVRAGTVDDPLVTALWIVLGCVAAAWAVRRNTPAAPGLEA